MLSFEIKLPMRVISLFIVYEYFRKNVICSCFYMPQAWVNYYNHRAIRSQIDHSKLSCASDVVRNRIRIKMSIIET